MSVVFQACFFPIIRRLARLKLSDRVGVLGDLKRMQLSSGLLVTLALLLILLIDQRVLPPGGVWETVVSLVWVLVFWGNWVNW